MIQSIWHSFQRHLQASAAYLPADRQRRLVRRIIWCAFGMFTLGAASTFFSAPTSPASIFLMTMAATNQCFSLVALALLQRGMPNAAAVVICGALYSVAVSLDLVAPATTVVGDPTAIRRVLDNLLTNAVNVTPEGGDVLVAVRPSPDGLELAVSDAGPGVADPVAIFEPYMSRAVGERRTGTSLGLGLAIVRELTSAMGGQTSVGSAPGQGSTFSIILPRSEEYAHHSCY